MLSNLWDIEDQLNYRGFTSGEPQESELKMPGNYSRVTFKIKSIVWCTSQLNFLFIPQHTVLAFDISNIFHVERTLPCK